MYTCITVGLKQFITYLVRLSLETFVKQLYVEGNIIASSFYREKFHLKILRELPKNLVKI